MNSRVRFCGLFIPESVRTAIYLVILFTQKYVFFNMGNWDITIQWNRKPDLYIFSTVFARPFLKQQDQGANRFSRIFSQLSPLSGVNRLYGSPKLHRLEPGPDYVAGRAGRNLAR